MGDLDEHVPEVMACTWGAPLDLFFGHRSVERPWEPSMQQPLGLEGCMSLAAVK